MKKLLLLSVLLLPTATHAQEGLQDYIKNLVTFTSDVLIPFLLAIAFLMFVINAIRYFVFESAEKEGREKAQALATYSILAFVIILVFWGVVNLLAGSFDFAGQNPVGSDYYYRDPCAGPNPPAACNLGGT